MRVSNTSIFSAIFFAFFSKKLYQEILVSWRKKVFVYILFVLFIAFIPFTSRFFVNAHTIFNRMTIILEKQLPIITLEKGMASVKPAGVHVIRYPGSTYKFAVIDMKKKYTQFNRDEAVFFVGPTSLQWKLKENHIKVYTYPPTLSMQFGPQTLKQLLHEYKHWIVFYFLVLAYTVGLFLAYGLYWFYASLLAIMTSMIVSCIDRKLSYRQNMRLTAVAATPVILVWAFLYGCNLLSLPFIALGLLAQFAYLIFSVLSCRQILKKVQVKEKKK